MAWQTPKTNWTAQDSVTPSELNRIEGNIAELKKASTIDIEDAEGNFAATNVEDALQELAGNVKNGKTSIANAIIAMGQTATGNDTFDTLAAKIRDISKDATAAEGNVLSGKTFYAGGSKKTGTMPNRGAVVITPSTQNQAIQQGYHNGQGYVKGDANLVAGNIAKGKSIFGITGTHEAYFEAGDDLLWGTTNPVATSSSTPSKIREIRILFTGSVRIEWVLKHEGGHMDAIGDCHGQIYKNGSPIGPERVVKKYDSARFFEDYNVEAGDLIQVYLWAIVSNPPMSMSSGNPEFYLKVAAPVAKVQPILGG